MATDNERGPPEDDRKIFVGGLPGTADKDKVEQYFSKYGEVKMCTIKTDAQTGRSRGFGFVVFADQSAVDQALSANASEGHLIENKKVDVKKATPQGSGGDQTASSKVFVGGFGNSFTSDDIKNAFSTRGQVEDVFLPVDKMTNEAKGFAFVTLADSALAQTLIAEGKITIDGKECDVKRANNKNDSRRGGRGGFRGRGGFGSGYDGGYGGGRGGYGSGYNSGSYGGGYDQYGGGGGYQGYQGGYGGPAGGYGGGGYGYNSYGDQNSGYSQY